MATTNPTLTASWSKLVDAGDEFLLTLPFSTRTSIEVAVKDADSAPTVNGHILRGDQFEAMNRTLIGPGYVYARTQGGSVPVILSSWTPA
jgi:hypothetical protein